MQRELTHAAFLSIFTFATFTLAPTSATESESFNSKQGIFIWFQFQHHQLHLLVWMLETIQDLAFTELEGITQASPKRTTNHEIFQSPNHVKSNETTTNNEQNFNEIWWVEMAIVSWETKLNSLLVLVNIQWRKSKELMGYNKWQKWSKWDRINRRNKWETKLISLLVLVILVKLLFSSKSGIE
jgi:hypothetical protein